MDEARLTVHRGTQQAGADPPRQAEAALHRVNDIVKRLRDAVQRLPGADLELLERELAKAEKEEKTKKRKERNKKRKKREEKEKIILSHHLPIPPERLVPSQTTGEFDPTMHSKLFR